MIMYCSHNCIFRKEAGKAETKSSLEKKSQHIHKKKVTIDNFNIIIQLKLIL